MSLPLSAINVKVFFKDIGNVKSLASLEIHNTRVQPTSNTGLLFRTHFKSQPAENCQAKLQKLIYLKPEIVSLYSHTPSFVKHFEVACCVSS